jgi:hypothetical protein
VEPSGILQPLAGKTFSSLAALFIAKLRAPATGQPPQFNRTSNTERTARPRRILQGKPLVLNKEIMQGCVRVLFRSFFTLLPSHVLSFRGFGPKEKRKKSKKRNV